MQVRVLHWLGVCLLLLVTACGGGGGGGGNSGLVLSFAPTRLEATTSVGYDTSVAVTATIDPSTLTSDLYIAMVDSQHVFTDFSIDQVSGTVSSVRFVASTASKAAGTYSGTVQVYLCKDYYCTSQYAGSPISLPYTVTVTSTPVAALLTPANISASTAMGVPVSSVLSARLSAAAGAAPEFAVQDSAGIFSPSVSAFSSGGSDYQLTITMGAINTVGTYSGFIRLSVCPSTCTGSNDILGSPVLIPYTVVVAVPVSSAVTLTPQTLSLSTSTGTAAQGTLAGVVGSQAGATPRFSIVDMAGRFSPTVSATQVSGSNYQFVITMGALNTPGTYTGTLNLAVCASACNGLNSVAGSPVAIPYTVVVTPPASLQPVASSSGLPEWETHQGNAAHTGFVPTTLNAGAFGLRWSRDLAIALHPAATADGKVFLATAANTGPATLYALSESDGSTTWSRNFSTAIVSPPLNPPATYGGRVFVATSGSTDTFMWSFDTADGTQRSKTPFGAQWEHYLAPTLLDGDVCFNGGTYGGIDCLYASTGANKWFTSLTQYDMWTPALDHTYAYSYTGPANYGAGGNFTVFNRSTGAIVMTMNDPGYVWQTYSMYVSPVIATTSSVLVVNGLGWNGTPKANHVIRYDLSSIYAPAESWRVGGTFLNNPVVAAGKLYLSNETGNRLEARDEQTGTLLWSWQPPSGETVSNANLVLVNNLVFVGTSAGTYAVDLNTHQTVWSVARTGKLAISSNRVLYIVGATGRVDAFNLF